MTNKSDNLPKGALLLKQLGWWPGIFGEHYEPAQIARHHNVPVNSVSVYADAALDRIFGMVGEVSRARIGMKDFVKDAGLDRQWALFAAIAVDWNIVDKMDEVSENRAPGNEDAEKGSGEGESKGQHGKNGGEDAANNEGKENDPHSATHIGKDAVNNKGESVLIDWYKSYRYRQDALKKYLSEELASGGQKPDSEWRITKGMVLEVCKQNVRDHMGIRGHESVAPRPNSQRRSEDDPPKKHKKWSEDDPPKKHEKRSEDNPP